MPPRGKPFAIKSLTPTDRIFLQPVHHHLPPRVAQPLVNSDLAETQRQRSSCSGPGKPLALRASRRSSSTDRNVAEAVSRPDWGIAFDFNGDEVATTKIAGLS